MIIDNYKYLLRAICIQDDLDSNSVICVYDIYNDYKLFTTFSRSKYCAEYFNVSINAIRSSMSRKSLIKNRFLLKRIVINNK